MGSKRAKRKADKAGMTDAEAIARGPKPNPPWYVPLMLGLMIVGLIWIVTFYLTRGEFPVQPWGNWNLAAGFGLIIAGFLMTTNWR
ncbi:cell division protein CrgA [Mobilicoccus caccae]|uniref:Cell division protein CrgA n=1 Tax=Mobilicoccus caccae TaxID=1859295 RepID=A0ABQ6IX22_9MICO|nr:cell division protein CrgA [Mobilicoccus caccae]GMA41687.1 hypothetical protein GCM10025883_37320 [Mobilicoccus caccae]